MDNPLTLVASVSFVVVVFVCTVLLVGLRPSSTRRLLACLLIPPLLTVAAGAAWGFSTFIRDGQLYFIPLFFWLGVAGIGLGAVAAIPAAYGVSRLVIWLNDPRRGDPTI